MSTITYVICVLLGIIIVAMVFLIIAFVYSLVIVYKQSKVFINNLKVGDETNFGKVTDLKNDYVIINQDPLQIYRSNIQPKEFKANKFLFMLGTIKK